MSLPRKLNRFSTTLYLLTFLSFGSLAAQKLEGMASFYADRFDNLTTSTGEVFRQNGFTAASLDLPWGTVVEVTNLSNGKSVQVWVNDCGPKARGRIIDLTRRAAEELDFIKQGETKVRLRVLQQSDAGPTCNRGAWAKRLKAEGRPVPPPPAPWDPTVTAKMTTTATSAPETVTPSAPTVQGKLRGLAGFYPDRLQGRPTSTGEVYDRNKLTAASKNYPYGTLLEVRNVVNGRSVQVRINDCGPNQPDRVLELSRVAADRLDIVRSGAAMVEMTVLSMGKKGPTCNRSAQENTEAVPPGGTKTAAPTTYSPPLGPTSSPAPISYQPENTVTMFRNQLGAFGNEKNAQRLAAKLLADGYDRVTTVDVGTMFKVFTGLSKTKAEAEKLSIQLVNKGYSKSKIVAVEVDQADLSAGGSASPEPTTYGAVAAPSQSVRMSPAPKKYDPDAVLFGVQVGAFSKLANAEKVKQQLAAAGFEEVFSFKVGKTYRVFTGKFYFQSQAEELKAKLREAGFSGASVRRVQ